MQELIQGGLRDLEDLISDAPLHNAIQQFAFFFRFLYLELAQFANFPLMLLLGLDSLDATNPSIEVTEMPNVRLDALKGSDRMMFKVQRIRPPVTQTARMELQEYKSWLNTMHCQGCGLERARMPSPVLWCAACRKAFYCNEACQRVDQIRPGCPHSVFCSTYDCRPVLLSAEQNGTMRVLLYWNWNWNAFLRQDQGGTTNREGQRQQQQQQQQQHARP
jgi:hypothetical protein